MTRILIVEDEPSVREMTCFTLKQSGYECLEAETAEEAREILTTGEPALILMDWMLPGVSGVELTRELKESPVTRM
ncbi:DNA-binding response regulator, partial [Solemya velum gill symbiont]